MHHGFCPNVFSVLTSKDQNLNNEATKDDKGQMQSEHNLRVYSFPACSSMSKLSKTNAVALYTLPTTHEPDSRGLSQKMPASNPHLLLSQLNQPGQNLL